MKNAKIALLKLFLISALLLNSAKSIPTMYDDAVDDGMMANENQEQDNSVTSHKVKYYY